MNRRSDCGPNDTGGEPSAGHGLRGRDARHPGSARCSGQGASPTSHDGALCGGFRKRFSPSEAAAWNEWAHAECARLDRLAKAVATEREAHRAESAPDETTEGVQTPMSLSESATLLALNSTNDAAVPLTLRELIKTRGRPRLRHGRAVYVPETKSIHLHVELGGRPYEVDLEQCDSAFDVMDWILHIGEKSWCDGQTLLDFINCLTDAFEIEYDKDMRELFRPQKSCDSDSNRK